MRKAFRLVVRPLSALSLTSGVLAMLGVIAASALAAAPALAAGDANKGACPNEASPGFRTYLPDCRAYELVTPSFKDGWPVLFGSGAFSEDGSSIVGTSLGDFAGGTGNDATLGNFYEFVRGASGWMTIPLNPPLPRFVQETGTAQEVYAATGPGVSSSGAALFAAHESTQSIYQADLYLRKSDGSFALVGPMLPASAIPTMPTGTYNGTWEGEVILGSSVDLSRALFDIQAGEHLPAGVTSNLWPGDATKPEEISLYEYVYTGTAHTGTDGEVPELVGVDNGGSQISQCGTTAVNNSSTKAPGISKGGSTVFFTAAAGGCAGGAGIGPAVGQLFARVGNPGSTQATINLAGTSECTVSATCNVTVTPTYQGSAADGSKVFFTTTQKLSSTDQDTTSDVYECELPGDSGFTPTPTITVNSCPKLVPVSVTGTASGANVQSVAAISGDGSHLYYVAKGVVTTTTNPYGVAATSGTNNLYVYNTVTHQTDFIGALATKKIVAQTTREGRVLVFAETADLTPDDTSTIKQIFEYEAGEMRFSSPSGGELTVRERDLNV